MNIQVIEKSNNNYFRINSVRKCQNNLFTKEKKSWYLRNKKPKADSFTASSPVSAVVDSGAVVGLRWRAWRRARKRRSCHKWSGRVRSSPATAANWIEGSRLCKRSRTDCSGRRRNTFLEQVFHWNNIDCDGTIPVSSPLYTVSVRSTRPPLGPRGPEGPSRDPALKPLTGTQ